MLVDTHCHLQFDAYDDDRDAVLANAAAAGVERMVVIGCDLPSSRAAAELAAAHPGTVYAAVGVHPNAAADFEPAMIEELRALAERPEVVAIGECGFDFFRDRCPVEQQREAFLAQQRLAVELDMPLIIHCRDAHEATIAALDEGGGLATRVVMHCFTSHEEWLDAVLSRGCWVGTDGPVTYPKADDARRIAAAVPSDRLLLETDSPFLAPHPYRGRRCEPAYVAEVAVKVAEVRQTPVDELIGQTGVNAARFYGWVG